MCLVIYTHTHTHTHTHIYIYIYIYKFFNLVNKVLKKALCQLDMEVSSFALYTL